MVGSSNYSVNDLLEKLSSLLLIYLYVCSKGTRSADPSCWSKLNTEADGFGTCDPSKNKTCNEK